MDVQLKQRLVGLTVIFSLAVIFLPMLLDGAGISRERMPDQPFPPEPEIEAGVNIEELVIELDKKTEKLVRLEPVIVDEISDPPGTDETQVTPSDEAVAPLVDKPTTPPASENAPKDEPKTEPRVSADKPPASSTSRPEAKPPVAEQAGEKEKVAAKADTEQDAQAEDSNRQSGGQSWVVQTGSFQEKDKAYAQRDTIRKSRLGAVFIEKYQHKGQLRYRVRMGPFLTREKANVVRNKLRAKHNLRAILMRYEK
jgi:DedD protein